MTVHVCVCEHRSHGGELEGGEQTGNDGVTVASHTRVKALYIIRHRLPSHTCCIIIVDVEHLYGNLGIEIDALENLQALTMCYHVLSRIKMCYRI